ncbi:MAG: glycerol-3-phosphate dehydrogenase/oxidase [Simkaniaceae bacterium]|nr:glycerol-3-phosphate dehydrogenase/oxidase [Simkaniaceae bacterium]MCF7853031.1 glycerol-3-phosphate dehydrogenase/oxidase [Simkaniaceae bacterium]
MTKTPRFDVIIIGGGATGLGAAVDSAARGYKTLLVEQYDFAKASSSRSTKLIHGGLRYLQQGNLSLVTEALKERGRLCHNAPHLISHRPFLVPNYQWWEGPFYGFGLKIYDALAGDLGLEKSHHIDKEETLKALPNLKSEGLKGGVIYYDGQFDDSRLAITLMKTCIDLGGIPLNYMCCESLIKTGDLITGVIIRDKETNHTYQVAGKCVINAGGIFSDQVRQLDTPTAKPRLFLSQGVHLVLRASLLSSDHAILVPHTQDDRVLFLVPWHGRVIAGTTDTPIKEPTAEPIALQSEIDFILTEAKRYLAHPITPSDVLSIFAGIRPLAKVSEESDTSKVSRDHLILTSESHLISIIGGKWTTYRKMGEDVINEAIKVAKLKKVACKTKTLKLHGYLDGADPDNLMSVYGSDIHSLLTLFKEDPSYSELIHPDLPYQKGEIIWAVRHEMARTIEDVLSRRTRSLLLGAKAARASALLVAHLMAKELGRDRSWIDEQVKTFDQLSHPYLPEQL